MWPTNRGLHSVAVSRRLRGRLGVQSCAFLYRLDRGRTPHPRASGSQLSGSYVRSSRVTLEFRRARKKLGANRGAVPRHRQRYTVGPSLGGVEISGLRTIVVLALVGLVLPMSGKADIAAVHVENSAEFAAAVSALRDTGGTIRLRRNHYGGELVVGSRSTRPLRIVGERGVRVESLLLEGTQHVSVSRRHDRADPTRRVAAHQWFTSHRPPRPARHR